MPADQDILRQVQASAVKRILFLPHAIRQMSRPDRMITTTEVQECIETGVLVEDYPEDPRGHSCLMLGRGTDGRPLHVVCAPKEDFLAIITAYLPSSREWEPDFKTRKQR